MGEKSSECRNFRRMSAGFSIIKVDAPDTIASVAVAVDGMDAYCQCCSYMELRDF
jgi:hypothetical protein